MINIRIRNIVVESQFKREMLILNSGMLSCNPQQTFYPPKSSKTMEQNSTISEFCNLCSHSTKWKLSPRETIEFSKTVGSVMFQTVTILTPSPSPTYWHSDQNLATM